jgi:colanic acid/amylovoran biosynthesis glycosyltransferase
MGAGEIVMVVSLKSGLAPFTRRDVVALVAAGESVLLVPTKVGAGIEAASLPAPAIGFSTAARAGGVLAGLARSLARPRALSKVLGSAARHREVAAALVAFQAFAASSRPALVYAVFGDRKLFAGYFLSLLTGAPLAVTIHAYELYDNPRPSLFREALAHASAVMTVTEHNREVLESRWGVPRERTDLVRVTVDPATFDARRRFVALIVGSWTDRKGHEDLLEAVRLLDDPAIELWIVGGPGGSHPVDVRAFASARGVLDRCLFFGQVDERAVASLMRRADVLVQPSRVDASGAMEGFPTAVAEAMFSCLPVIVTDHAEMPRVVESIVVPERSPGALADALRTYRDDPALRSADGARNRAVAERLFGPQSHLDLLRVLHGAMGDE